MEKESTDSGSGKLRRRIHGNYAKTGSCALQAAGKYFIIKYMYWNLAGNNMCEQCETIKTIDCFPTPGDYLACLKYIQSLVDSGNFLFESRDCDTDKVKDADGHWIDDVISHVIQCKNCGQCFTCTAITYSGRGSFRKG